jgi:hypothetical protein
MLASAWVSTERPDFDKESQIFVPDEPALAPFLSESASVIVMISSVLP